MEVKQWNGYNIRFIPIGGEYWGVLEDICEALNYKQSHVIERMDHSMLRTYIFHESGIPYEDLADPSVFNPVEKYLVNELGIYEMLYTSRRPEARMFQAWSSRLMQSIRKKIGLPQTDMLMMTDSVIQEKVLDILDSLYYDEESGLVMQSITIKGGDVEQVVYKY